MSARVPCATLASLSPVEGSVVSKYCPEAGFSQAPLMKCPNRRPCPSSQSSASRGSSGAAPYSILMNFSTMLMRSCSIFSHSLLPLGDRMTVVRRVAPRGMVLELPLDVRQHAAGAEAKQIRAKPRRAKLLFHQRQPFHRLLGRADAAGRFETDGHPGLVGILADGAGHHQADRQRGVNRFLARRSLDEIRSGHHGDHARACHVAKREQVAGPEDHLHVGGAAGALERCDFAVEGLPFSATNMRSRADHVNLRRAGFRRAADFRDAFREGRKTRREPRRNSSNSYAAALQSAQRRLHESVIDANGGYFQAELSDLEPLHNFLLDGLAGFRAHAAHALFGIVARERRQVHAGNGAQEPSRLPFLLYRPPRNEGLGAAFHRAGVDADFFHPIHVERDAMVRVQSSPGKRGERRFRCGMKVYFRAVDKVLGRARMPDLIHCHGTLSVIPPLCDDELDRSSATEYVSEGYGNHTI